MQTFHPPDRGRVGPQGRSSAADTSAVALSEPHATLRWLLLCFCWVMVSAPLPLSAAADDAALVGRWVQQQTNLQTWQAELVQTRTLKTLTHPLISTGRVWFAVPNRFRWELGQPAQTIALRQTNEMWVVYPRLKRAEHYPLDGGISGPWRDALALLEAGFPTSEAELNSRFKVASITRSNETAELVLHPKSASARQMMPQLKIWFETNRFTLRGTELQFADGSTMRNDFFNSQLNPTLAADLFHYPVPGYFKVSKPLSGRK